MSRFGRWLHRLLERWMGRYYEGPNPPDRLGEMVIVFANEYPTITRQEWADYASAHARNCYRAGFMRGMEYIERDPDWYGTVHPEFAADQLDPNWRFAPEVQLDFPDEVPPTEALDEAGINAFFQRNPR
jgi:hypothetical protein